MSRLLHAGALAAGLTLVSAVAMAQPLPVPQIFAPGVISDPSNDGSPTFSPDGKTLYFTRSGATAGTILESHLVEGSWSKPIIAPFSGEWNDQHPVFSHDGSYLIFVSTRPVPGISQRVAHLWLVRRTSDGWSAPEHLPAAVNIGPRIFAPSIAADGSIYFLGIGPQRAFQLYRARFVDGAYETARPLSFSNPKTADVDPCIAPDQSFIVFASSGRNGATDAKEHLYVAYNRGGTWSGVRPLHYAGDADGGGSNDNEPRLSPDGKTLYFASDRSIAIHFPRTQAQATFDEERIETWDNGNGHVWTIPFDQPGA